MMFLRNIAIIDTHALSGGEIIFGVAGHEVNPQHEYEWKSRSIDKRRHARKNMSEKNTVDASHTYSKVLHG